MTSLAATTRHASRKASAFAAMACAALMLALASCSASRKAVAYYDDIYDSGFQSVTPQQGLHIAAQAGASPQAKRLLDEAFAWLGTPYQYGGHSKQGTDCSGFTLECYKRSLGISLPRSSADQAQACQRVDRAHLRPGDLVFFHCGSASRINHVGIYIGDGKFIHASSSRGVMVSELDAPYWQKAYAQSGRCLK